MLLLLSLSMKNNTSINIFITTEYYLKMANMSRSFLTCRNNFSTITAKILSTYVLRGNAIFWPFYSHRYATTPKVLHSQV